MFCWKYQSDSLSKCHPVYEAKCLFSLCAAKGFCTCMQRGQMWPLWCLSPWGKSQKAQLPDWKRCPLRGSPCSDASLFLTRGEHCGGCRRSNNTERPHAFQVILTERPPLVLSANDEQDMAEWMQLLCQSVSKGVSGESWNNAPFILQILHPLVLS